ncbi:ANTAR domain-containing response regulator [Flaviflagellibacter deserti]|jgi:two-component system, response regulator / RNA-binding antiterminator|uniref:ANTAR domain-containing response regulator n=1 Tax=Flaviflagellibacter deserti TaxID=2267266 RepID=A0ABV9Z426_9HYPH
MAIQILKDLRGLKVTVIHPHDAEGVDLIEHLKRIGCTVEALWPIPAAFPAAADVVILAIDHENRETLQKLLKEQDERGPTLIAVVGYEDPATLQIVIESGALAIVQRPIRPFGLLTNLLLARSLWLERSEAERKIRKLERKIGGMQKTQKAKTILMSSQGLTEDAAYETMRRQAMSKRVSVEEIAVAIINAYELLNGPVKGA